MSASTVLFGRFAVVRLGARDRPPGRFVTEKGELPYLLLEYKEPLYAAPPLLARMVDAGRLGRKSGSGFYSY